MGAFLVSLKDGKPDLTFVVPESGCLVGRDPGCLIQMQDAHVSRRHVRIVSEGGRWFAQDLDTRNGTRVNGAVAARSEIRNGDRIGIGSTELIFTTDDPSQTNFKPGHVIDFSTQAAQNTLDGRKKPL